MVPTTLLVHDIAIFVKLPALKVAKAFTATIHSIFFPSELSTVNEFATVGGFVVG